MSGEVPLGGGGIALRECLAYGTIASEVVTHRLLLQMCCALNTEYTLSQPLKRPFHNNLEKCTVVKNKIINKINDKSIDSKKYFIYHAFHLLSKRNLALY